MKFTPFPTFGGKQGIAGVQPVQLPQVRTSFPQTRGPVRRAPEPTTKEKIAGLLPLVTRGIASGITGLFRKDETPMSMDEYYKSIGADPQDLSKEEKALGAAYAAYGPQEDVGGFRGMDVVDLLAASQLGRGAPAYTKTAFALRSAEDSKNIAVNKARGELIKDYLKEDQGTASFVNLLDTDALRNRGVTIVKPALFYSKGDDAGKPFLIGEDGELNLAGENWIKYVDMESADATALKDPISVEFFKDYDEIKNKDIAATQFLNIAVPQLELLNQAIQDPSKSGITTVADIANFANSMGANFKQIASFFGQKYGAGQDDIYAIFSKDENGGGTELTRGTGKNAENAFRALERYKANPDDPEAEALLSSTFATLMETQPTYKKGFMDKVGPTAFQNVAQQANFLQMAYMLAAMNGQTGRTLSDKDLAYHLQIVGFGATQDANVAYHNLLRVTDQMLSGLELETRRRIGPNTIKHLHRTNNQTGLSLITDFYKPPLIEGTEDYDFGNANAYEFIPFTERSYNKGIKIFDQYSNLPSNPDYYQRKIGTPTNPNAIINQDVLNDEISRDTNNIKAMYD